jgi:hypothetical protein
MIQEEELSFIMPSARVDEKSETSTAGIKAAISTREDPNQLSD